MPREFEIRRAGLSGLGEKVFGTCIVGKYGCCPDKYGGLKTTRAFTILTLTDGKKKIGIDHMWVSRKTDPRIWELPKGTVVTFTANTYRYGNSEFVNYGIENIILISIKPI